MKAKLTSSMNNGLFSSLDNQKGFSKMLAEDSQLGKENI